MNSNSMFTLAQKVYAVQSYYKGDESASHVMDCLNRRYGIKNTEENTSTISRIIRTFENTGSILNRFYYSTAPSPAKKPVPPIPRPQPPSPSPTVREPTAPQVENVHIVELCGDDDLIVEVLSEFDQDNISVRGHDDDYLVTVVEDVELHDGEGDEEEQEGEEVEMIFKQESSSSSSAEVAQAKRPDREHLCPQCGLTVAGRLLQKHLQSHEDPNQPRRKFKCDVCPLEFSTRSNVSTHRRKHFPHLQFVCEICAKVSTNNAIHKNHMLVRREGGR